MATVGRSSALPFKAGTRYALTAGWRYRRLRPSAHFAYDLAAREGTPIIAPADGYVVDCRDGVNRNSRWQRRYSGMPSNWIIMKHRFGSKWYYAFYQHLQKGLYVRKGQLVKKGQVIAKVGLTGNTSGPHLHWAASKIPLSRSNPYAYMSGSGRNALWPPTQLAHADTLHGNLAVDTAGGRVRSQDAPYMRALKVGMRGWDVMTIQRHLGVVQTGYFGKTTKAAVKKFQRTRPKLWPADGVVGPQTYKAILKKRPK